MPKIKDSKNRSSKNYVNGRLGYFKSFKSQISLKVIRSRNKNCGAVTSPKNKQMNLFSYPFLTTQKYLKHGFQFQVSSIRMQMALNFELVVSDQLFSVLLAA